jgi:hypothetical protein
LTLPLTKPRILFDQEERGPDDDLRLEFEATRRLAPAQKEVLREVIESLLVKQEVSRLVAAPSGSAA